jgi:hypothetical protein
LRIDVDQRDAIKRLDYLLETIWDNAGLSDGKPGDDFPMRLLGEEDVVLLTEIENTLSVALSCKSITPTAQIWHDASASPPSEYPAGPLTGTKKQLAKWIMRKADHRLLDTPLKEGTYWGRQNVRNQCSIWFKTQQRFAEANKLRLADNGSTDGSTDVEKR